jgi:hypothetical protein
MHFFAMLLLLSVALTVPPAAKVLAIVGTIYAVIQALKRVPALTPYLKGWVAIALNVALSIGGLLVTVPASQLYTTDTLITLLTTALGAAGIHGTVKSLTTAQ